MANAVRYTDEQVTRIEDEAYELGVRVGRREALDEMRRLQAEAGEYDLPFQVTLRSLPFEKALDLQSALQLLFDGVVVTVEPSEYAYTSRRRVTDSADDVESGA